MANAPHRPLEIRLRPDPLTLGLASPFSFFFFKSFLFIGIFIFFNCMG